MFKVLLIEVTRDSKLFRALQPHSWFCGRLSPNNMAVNGDGMIESGIFESLQRKIDDDGAVKDVRRMRHQSIRPVCSSLFYRLCVTSCKN